MRFFYFFTMLLTIYAISFFGGNHARNLCRKIPEIPLDLLFWQDDESSRRHMGD